MSLTLAQPTVTAALKHLKIFGSAREESGEQRDRVFVYRGDVGLLKEN